MSLARKHHTAGYAIKTWSTSAEVSGMMVLSEIIGDVLVAAMSRTEL